jgi:hypothetical protein
VVEVNIDPAQPGELAAAHAGGGDQQPQGVQAVVADMVEERAQFLGCPDLLFGGAGGGWVGRLGDVADQVPPAHRVMQGAVQHHVHVADGLGRQPGSAAVDRLAPATLQQVGVEVVELHGSEGLELDLAEDGHDVGGGVGAVVGPGGGAQPRLHGRQPLVLEEVAEGVGGALGEPSRAPLADRFGQGVLGGLLGLVAALGPLASAAGERVGVDVEVPGPGGSALVDGAAHQLAALGSTSTEGRRPIFWRTSSVGTNSLPHMRTVGRSPLAAAR